LFIVDFKTKKMPDLKDCIGAVPQPNSANCEGSPLVELADFQLPMYIRLAENEFGKPADSALFFSILDSKPEVLFGVIQNVIHGETIPAKEQQRIMRGSDEYERIMGEFDKKAGQFAAEISTGAILFSPSHWELCRECEYNRVCRTLYEVFQGERQWNQAKKK
jgi:hypothetical protein